MTSTLEFRQHEEFHRAALHMALAGAVAGLIAFLAFQGASSPWALAIVAGATVFGALSPTLRRYIDELAARVGLLAGAAGALALLTQAGEPTSALIVFSLLFGAALGWGLRGRKLWIAIACGAAVAVLGRYVFLSISAAQELASLPGWAVSTVAGAAFSFVSVFALLPRHIEISRDTIDTDYQRLRGSVTGEARQLVERGYELWSRARVELGDDETSSNALRDSVVRLFEVAHRWQSVEAAGTQNMASSLVERIDELDGRIANSDDDITVKQYEQAKAALTEQLRYIKDINTSRERVLARMHNYLAAMERLRMAAINLASTNASRDAVADIQPLVHDLEKLGADIDTCSVSLLEAERLSAS
ncbi:MAG: hypothetical protein AAGC55_11920 [Myxococcota bacterium]